MSDIRRAYQQTHPWIKFELDLQYASSDLSMLLGEVQSKCEHIAGVPLLPDVAERLHHLYLVKGVAATTAIEGNTLTEEEVRQKLEGTLELPPSQEYLAREVENTRQAYNRALDNIFEQGWRDLSIEEICGFNKLILDGLQLEADVVPGRLRKHQVTVGRYRAALAEDCEYLLSHTCNWINTLSNPWGDHRKIAFGVLKALLTHLYIAWIHPFGDGNGRTARLLEFKLLLTAGIPIAAAHLLSDHYNLTRTEYYRQLQRASESGGNVLPFLEYALQGFVDGLQRQLRWIRDQQILVFWKSYIYDQFKGKESDDDARRGYLMLDLLEFEKQLVPLDQITDISPRVAREYAQVSDHELWTDLSVLQQMGLIEMLGRSIKDRRDQLSNLMSPSFQMGEDVGGPVQQLSLELDLDLPV